MSSCCVVLASLYLLASQTFGMQLVLLAVGTLLVWRCTPHSIHTHRSLHSTVYTKEGGLADVDLDSLFDMASFRSNPKPFFELAKVVTASSTNFCILPCSNLSFWTAPSTGAVPSQAAANTGQCTARQTGHGCLACHAHMLLAPCTLLLLLLPLLTQTHYFLRLLHEKGILRRVFTQVCICMYVARAQSCSLA